MRSTFSGYQVIFLHTATMVMDEMGLYRARLAKQVSFNIRPITLRGGHFYTATHLITELIKYAIAVPQSARASRTNCTDWPSDCCLQEPGCLTRQQRNLDMSNIMYDSLSEKLHHR